VVNIGRAQHDRPGVGRMVDDMDEQSNKAINEVLPGPGCLSNALLEQVTVKFGECHGLQPPRSRRVTLLSIPVESTSSTQESVRFFRSRSKKAGFGLARLASGVAAELTSTSVSDSVIVYTGLSKSARCNPGRSVLPTA